MWFHHASSHTFYGLPVLDSVRFNKLDTGKQVLQMANAKMKGTEMHYFIESSTNNHLKKTKWTIP